MTRKQAHIIISLFDLLALVGLIILCHEFSQIILKISNQVEKIRLGNRTGFLIVGIGMPILHLLVIIEYFWPEHIKTKHKMLNIGIIAGLIALLVAGYVGSMWMTSRVENAGYVYCREASGAGAFSKTLVYTRNINICEKLAASWKR